MDIRITPKNILSLKDNEIFVFGSNTSGRHGKGAAKTAMKFGAIYGKGEGLQGKTYAIPTVNGKNLKALSIDQIAVHVETFIYFVNKCYKLNDLVFLVTPIGCGLAGYKVKDIAPMFKELVSLENVYLPECFFVYYN